MEFRKTIKKDVNNVMKIIKQAQDYFKSQGVDQWQNGYPNEETIENDIKNDESYVLEKDGEIVATTMLTFNGEPTYASIQGKWLSKRRNYRKWY